MLINRSEDISTFQSPKVKKKNLWSLFPLVNNSGSEGSLKSILVFIPPDGLALHLTYSSRAGQLWAAATPTQLCQALPKQLQAKDVLFVLIETPLAVEIIFIFWYNFFVISCIEALWSLNWLKYMALCV